MVKETKTASKTKAVGRELASQLKGGEALLLQGELGSGKTTFVKGLAQGLGVRDDITSPTFLMLRPYQGANQLKLVHVDGYRLGSSDDLQSLGLEDYLSKQDTVVVIEWPERLKRLSRSAFKGLKVKKFKFYVINETTRRISY